MLFCFTLSGFVEPAYDEYPARKTIYLQQLVPCHIILTSESLPTCQIAILTSSDHRPRISVPGTEVEFTKLASLPPDQTLPPARYTSVQLGKGGSAGASRRG